MGIKFNLALIDLYILKLYLLHLCWSSQKFIGCILTLTIIYHLSQYFNLAHNLTLAIIYLRPII